MADRAQGALSALCRLCVQRKKKSLREAGRHVRTKQSVFPKETNGDFPMKNGDLYGI